MAFKIVTIFTLVAVASAVEYSQHDLQYATQPVYKQVVQEAPAEYDFAYAVEDPHTGDVKSHQESRKGDVVHGQYSLIDADGHRRIVEYTVDAHSGFKAVVRREPVKGYVAKAPVAYKQVVPQVQHVHAAPQAYVHQAAPQAYVHQAAPQVYVQPQQAYVHRAAPQVAQAYVHQPAQVYVQQPHAQVQHVAQQVYAHQAPQVTQAYVQAAPQVYQSQGGQHGNSVSYSSGGQNYHY